MDNITIKPFEVLDTEFCVESDDGQKIFDLIMEGFSADKVVTVDFDKIDLITSSFLNSAFGQLYKDNSEDFVKSRLKVSNLADIDIRLLKKVVDTAKLYYSDPEHMQRSIDEIMGDTDE